MKAGMRSSPPWSVKPGPRVRRMEWTVLDWNSWPSISTEDRGQVYERMASLQAGEGDMERILIRRRDTAGAYLIVFQCITSPAKLL